MPGSSTQYLPDMVSIWGRFKASSLVDRRVQPGQVARTISLWCGKLAILADLDLILISVRSVVQLYPGPFFEPCRNASS